LGQLKIHDRVQNSGAIVLWEFQQESLDIFFAHIFKVQYHSGIIIFDLHNIGSLPTGLLLGWALASAFASYSGPASLVSSLFLVTVLGNMPFLFAIKASPVFAQLFLFFRTQFLEPSGVNTHRDHLIMGPLARWSVVPEFQSGSPF
jgi:hypothetical protein